MLNKRLAFGWILLCLPLLLAACTPAPQEQMDLQPCVLGGNIAAQCGALSVFENRAAHSGTTIAIHVAVIKARS